MLSIIEYWSELSAVEGRRYDSWRSATDPAATSQPVPAFKHVSSRIGTLRMLVGAISSEDTIIPHNLTCRPTTLDLLNFTYVSRWCFNSKWRCRVIKRQWRRYRIWKMGILQHIQSWMKTRGYERCSPPGKGVCPLLLFVKFCVNLASF